MAVNGVNPGVRVPPPVPPRAQTRTRAASNVATNGPSRANNNPPSNSFGKNAGRMLFAAGLAFQPVRVADNLLSKGSELPRKALGFARRHPRWAIALGLTCGFQIVAILAILALPKIVKGVAKGTAKGTVGAVHGYGRLRRRGTPRFDAFVADVNQARAIVAHPLATRAIRLQQGNTGRTRSPQSASQNASPRSPRGVSPSAARKVSPSPALNTPGQVPDFKPTFEEAWTRRETEANQQTFNTPARKKALTEAYETLRGNLLAEKQPLSPEQADKTLEAMFGKKLSAVIAGIPDNDVHPGGNPVTPAQLNGQKNLLAVLNRMNEQNLSGIGPELAANIAVGRRATGAGRLTTDQAKTLAWTGKYSTSDITRLGEMVDASHSVNTDKIHAPAQGGLNTPSAAATVTRTPTHTRSAATVASSSGPAFG